MKQYIQQGFKKWWYLPFLVYLMPNVLMSIFVLISHILIVDNVPIQLTATTIQVIIAIGLVIASFYYIKFLCLKFNTMALKYRKSYPSKYIGKLIFIFQVLQLISLLIFDFGRVGGVSTSSNIFVVLMSYLPSDILFLVYYAHTRDKGIPWFNLCLYLTIAVLQGWSGIWMLLFFIEFFFLLKRKAFKTAAKYGLVIIIALVSLYPIINKYKYILRGGEDFEERTTLESAGNLINRLQHAANVILIAQEEEQISLALDRNEITPYYLDNRLGASLGHSNNSVTLQKYLTTNYLINRDLFNPTTDIDELGWFTHVGIAGWFLVLSPIQILFYIIFIILITVLPFLINHYFLRSLDIISVLQTLTLAYAFHGWLSVQISFISGIILYVLLCNIFSPVKE